LSLNRSKPPGGRPQQATSSGNDTAAHTISPALNSASIGDGTVVDLLLPLVHVLVLFSILRFAFGWIWPGRDTALGELVAPFISVLRFTLKLCQLAARGVYRQVRAIWRNSIRERGWAMTTLLTLIVIATITTVAGVFAFSLPVLLWAASFWFCVWQLWHVTNWLAQRRYRARPLPARRRR
jgi:hypothetical protein